MNLNSGMGPLLKYCGEVEIELISFKDLMNGLSKSIPTYISRSDGLLSRTALKPRIRSPPSAALVQIQRQADQ
jgi:hypothetical protein